MPIVKTPKPGVQEARTQHVQVFVRVRPLNSQEIAHKCHNIVTVKGPREVTVNDQSTPKISKTYTFDGVFDPSAEQALIYNRVASQCVADVLDGYNCTVFAYGQTGSGKTYTMEGDISDSDKGANAGIIPRAMASLFDELRMRKAEFTVRISFLELYNEELYDLLASDEIPPKLRLFDDPAKKGSIVIQGLEELLVYSKTQVLDYLQKGLMKRQVAATQMNAVSSRSHTVFCATIHTKESSLEGEDVKFGKLYLVDLAGSENIGRSGSVDKRAREAGSINQSLLTLGRVISCLVERQPHVPYRESKLTRLLQDSLGGRTKTSIIATVSPASSNLEETISTLDYALKAKSVSNKPEINQKVSKEAVMKEYAVLIEDLKKKLYLTQEGTGVYINNENYRTVIQQLEERNKDLVDKIAEIRVCVDERKRYERLFEEFSSNLSGKEQVLEDVKRDLEKTKSFVQEKRERLDAEREKLTETTGIVEEVKEYENHIHGQAENLISIVEKCQDDSVKLHSTLDDSKAIKDSNLRYASALLFELNRLKKSVSDNLGSFAGAGASVTTLCRQLRDLKNGSDEELQKLKDLANNIREKVLITADRCLDATEDLKIYKNVWNEENLSEVTEQMNLQVIVLTGVENDMKSCFDDYRNLINTIGEMKGDVARTVHEVLKEWLMCIENASGTSLNALKEATQHFVSCTYQGEKAFKNVESSVNNFYNQEERFGEERSKVIADIKQRVSGLEKMLEDQCLEGKQFLANTDELVENAEGFVESCEPSLAKTIVDVQETAVTDVSERLSAAPSVHHAVTEYTGKWDTQKCLSITDQTELTCEKTCETLTEAWAALASDAEAALSARERECRDNHRVQEQCLEEMRNELAELQLKYSEEAKKIREKYGKFREEKNSSLDQFGSLHEKVRSDLADHLDTSSTLVRTFISDQFKRDCPTGNTPPRKSIKITPLNDPLASPEVRRIVRKVEEDKIDLYV